MPTVSAPSRQASEERPANPDVAESKRPRGWIGWSSLFFAVLQSICTFFAAMGALRLAIGLGAFALSAGVGATIHWLHSDPVRLPMVILAVAGSVLNLVVLWQIRRLRDRPSAQWRQKPLSRRTIRMERVQLILSIATLVLITIEEYWHIRWHHHI